MQARLTSPPYPELLDREEEMITHHTESAAQPSEQRQRLLEEYRRKDGADHDGEGAHWCLRIRN